MVGLPEVGIARVVFDVDHIVIHAFGQAQAVALDALGDDGRTADQDRPGQVLVDDDLHRAQYAFFLALGIDHALALGHAGGVEDRLHDAAGGIHEGLQLVLVGLHVGDRAQRDTGVHGGLGHGRGDHQHQARIEGLGNQVFGAEAQVVADVGGRHHFGLFGAGQAGNGAHGGDFHLGGDGAGPAVQRAPEDVGEAQHVVDLVRVIGAAGRHDGVIAHGLDFFRRDFGGRVGECEDQRPGSHFGDHVRFQHAAGGQAEEHVGTFDYLAQRTQRAVLGELGLVLVHQLGAALVDQAVNVGDPDVLARHAELDQQVDTGQRRGTGTGGHDLDLVDLLADHVQAVQEGRADHDGGAVLVVVEHRDVEAFTQLALDVEAVGGLDVLEVDAAESGFQRGDDFDQPVGILLVDLDVEHIDAGEFLEQHALAFHDRLAGQRADVAEAEHGRAVGDHADQVAARGVAEGGGRVLDDFLAGGSDAGRVGQSQIGLVDHLLGGLDADLAGLRELVVVECGLAECGVAGALLGGVGHGGTRARAWRRVTPQTGWLGVGCGTSHCRRKQGLSPGGGTHVAPAGATCRARVGQRLSASQAARDRVSAGGLPASSSASSCCQRVRAAARLPCLMWP